LLSKPVLKNSKYRKKHEPSSVYNGLCNERLLHLLFFVCHFVRIRSTLYLAKFSPKKQQSLKNEQRKGLIYGY